MLDLVQLHQNIRALDKGDDASQRQAIRCLRQFEQQDWAAAPAAVFQPLIGSLQQQLLSGGKPPLVHKEIAEILGKMGPRSKSAVPQLVQLLHEGTPEPVREAAAMALGRLGVAARDAVDRLLELASGPGALAIHAVRALSEIGCADHRVRTALVSLWLGTAHTQHAQMQIAVALCKLRIDAKGLQGFLTGSLIGSQDDAVRKAAAEALAWCNKNDNNVVPALLMSTLNDKNETVRLTSQAALDQLRLSREKAILLCAKQLLSSTYAETALRKSGQPAVPALIEVLGADVPAARIKAAQLLAGLGELAAAAVPVLTAALRDRDAEIRLAAAKGLWNVAKNAELVVPVLIVLLEEKRAAPRDDSEGRRRFVQTIIEALWRIGPPAKAAMPALMDSAKDKNRMISESAQNALKRIAP